MAILRRNVGSWDQVFRVVVGVVAIGLGVYFKSWWGTLGVIPLLTGLFGWCPLYVPFATTTRGENPNTGSGAAVAPR